MTSDKKGMPTCHVCGKAFKDRRGLAGHLWSVHGIKASQCEEYMNGPKEVLVMEDCLRDLFDLNEDLKEYDERLKAAKSSPTGSFFGLGFIPIQSEQDKELIELLEFLIKAKEEEGKRMVEELVKLKKESFARVENPDFQGVDTGKNIGFLEEMGHNQALSKHKLKVIKQEKVQRLQKAIESNGTQEDLREAVK